MRVTQDLLRVVGRTGRNVQHAESFDRIRHLREGEGERVREGERG